MTQRILRRIGTEQDQILQRRGQPAGRFGRPGSRYRGRPAEVFGGGPFATGRVEHGHPVADAAAERVDILHRHHFAEIGLSQGPTGPVNTRMLGESRRRPRESDRRADSHRPSAGRESAPAAPHRSAWCRRYLERRGRTAGRWPRLLRPTTAGPYLTVAATGRRPGGSGSGSVADRCGSRHLADPQGHQRGDHAQPGRAQPGHRVVAGQVPDVAGRRPTRARRPS